VCWGLAISSLAWWRGCLPSAPCSREPSWTAPVPSPAQFLFLDDAGIKKQKFAIAKTSQHTDVILNAFNLTHTTHFSFLTFNAAFSLHLQHCPVLRMFPTSYLVSPTSISVSMALQHFGPWPFFSFLILYTVGRSPWTGDQPVARPLPTYTQNKRTQTSMPRVGFKPTIPVFERAKTIHAPHRAAAVTGIH
jgi:hypothetical protein